MGEKQINFFDQPEPENTAEMPPLKPFEIKETEGECKRCGLEKNSIIGGICRDCREWKDVPKSAGKKTAA